MKDRRPRKLKKKLKRKFENVQAVKIETAQKISEIMNSGPKNWREA